MKIDCTETYAVFNATCYQVNLNRIELHLIFMVIYCAPNVVLVQDIASNNEKVTLEESSYGLHVSFL